MAELYDVGADATTATDMENVVSVEAALQDVPATRDQALGRIANAVSSRASKAYVDTQDANYPESAYHTTQNGLLVPNSAKGAAGGVATLGSNGKIPSAQVPILGAGVLRGPYGFNTAFSPTTGSTPAKVCEWNSANYALNGWPMVFMSVACTATDGRTVIEVRASQPGQTAYSDQVLVSRGFGRVGYKDYQVIPVLPVTANLGEHQDGVQNIFAASVNWGFTAWLYNSSTGSSATQSGQIGTAVLYWAAVAL